MRASTCRACKRAACRAGLIRQPGRIPASSSPTAEGAPPLRRWRARRRKRVRFWKPRFVVEDYIAPERGFITRVELVDGAVALIVKRSVVKGGLSAYHLGSRYGLYPECAEEIRATAVLAGRALGIGFGSFDIIENGGRAYVIDANSVSNVSPDNTETFGGFDLMREYAQAIAKRGHRG